MPIAYCRVWLDGSCHSRTRPKARRRRRRRRTIKAREVSATGRADPESPEAVFGRSRGGGWRREVIVSMSGPDVPCSDGLICRCPAGAFLAANLRARAAAGGCSSCALCREGCSAHSTGRFPLHIHAGLVSCPATPGSERQCGSRPRMGGCLFIDCQETSSARYHRATAFCLALD